MQMKFFRMILVSLLLSAASAGAFSLNDFSILLPLPRAGEEAFLLRPESVGARGALLSYRTYQQLFQLVQEHSNEALWRDQLKVVAVRLDPCFVEGPGPWNCRRQIRLVWQPVIWEEGAYLTRDAAIHSFYEFDERTFAELWQQWRGLASGSRTDILQVHPRLRTEGFKGVYWKVLRNIILEYCGEKNLVRMTSMNVMAEEQLWIFSGFDIVDGKSKSMTVPRVGGPTHAVTQTSFQFQSYTGGITPEPDADREFAELVSDSYSFKKRYSETQVRELVRTIAGYENPDKHNPGTLDCASCHMANMTYQWARKQYPQFLWESEFRDALFTSVWNLNNSSRTDVVRPNQLRAFGYFGRDPAISQRVINETASVAGALVSSPEKF